MKKRLIPKGESIADYAWLDRTQRSWHLWAGNPFCLSLYRIPLTMEKDDVIKLAKKGQAKEKKRFAKRFPDIQWNALYGS